MNYTPNPLFMFNVAKYLREKYAEEALHALKFGPEYKTWKTRSSNAYARLGTSLAYVKPFTRGQRINVCKRFEFLRKLAYDKNISRTYFRMDDIVRLMYQKGYHLVDKANSVFELKYAIREGKRFQLLFRNNNIFLMIEDDFIWQEFRQRRPFRLWKMLCMNDTWKQLFELMEVAKTRNHSDYKPEVERALSQATATHATLQLQLEHRESFLDRENPKYYLDRISAAIP